MKMMEMMALAGNSHVPAIMTLQSRHRPCLGVPYSVLTTLGRKLSEMTMLIVGIIYSPHTRTVRE